MYPHYSWMNAACETGIPVYSYQFTKENGFHGTYHAGEMIYAYGNVKKDTHSYRYDKSDIKLSETMLKYWSNFVKFGHPSSTDVADWSTYNPLEPKLMELGNTVAPKAIPELDLDAFALCQEYSEYLLTKGANK